MSTSEQCGRPSTLHATGTLSVVLTLNIGTRYFPEEEPLNYETFRLSRGTGIFARDARAAMQRACQSGQFAEDDDADIPGVGHETGVFSQYLVDYELVPAVKLVSRTDPLSVQLGPYLSKDLAHAGILAPIQGELDARLLKEWNHWTSKTIRLSRYGLFQVTLRNHLTKPTSVLSILDSVLGLDQSLDIRRLLQEKLRALHQQEQEIANLLDGEDRLPEIRAKLESISEASRTYARLIESGQSAATALEPSLQWELSREVIYSFVNAIGRMVSEGIELLPQPLFRRGHTGGVSYPLRFRYVVLDFTELYRSEDDTVLPIVPADLRDCERAELSCLLEGVPVEHPHTRVALLGDYKHALTSANLSEDVSTWERELCIFSGDNALFVRNYPPTMGLRFPRRVPYHSYWSCISRGVSYICELRTIAKFLESTTSDDLERAGGYSKTLSRANPTDLLPLVRGFSARVAHLSQLAARVRNASQPTTMARADYAVDKFQALADRFDIRTIVEHSQDNVVLLGSFLAHFDGSVNHANSLRTTSLGLVATIFLTAASGILSVLALPTFMADLNREDSLLAQASPDALRLFGWVGALGAAILTFLFVLSFVVAGVYYRRIRLQSKRPLFPSLRQ